MKCQRVFYFTLASHFNQGGNKNARVLELCFKQDNKTLRIEKFFVLSWIAALNDGLKVGIYASDVFGAFARVNVDRLIENISIRCRYKIHTAHQKLASG